MMFTCKVCDTPPLLQNDYVTHTQGADHMKLVSSPSALIDNKSFTEMVQFDSEVPVLVDGNDQTGTHSKEGLDSPLSEEKHKAEELPNRVDEKNEVILTNLPLNCRSANVSDYVSQFGTPVEKYVNLRRRFARFTFKDNEPVKAIAAKPKSFERNGLIIDVWNNGKDSLASSDTDKRNTYNNSITKALEAHMSIEEEVTIITKNLLSDQCEAHKELCKDLKSVISQLLSQNTVLHAFGSAVFGLAFMGSDLDIVVDMDGSLKSYQEEFSLNKSVSQISYTDNNFLNDLKKCMVNDRQKIFSRIVTITSTRVPILKCYHCPTGIKCDVSIKNVGAVQNTKLIRYLMSLDPRVKPLMLVVKYWAKYFDVIATGIFTNYALLMMVIFYLQQLDNPILPPIAHLQPAVHRKLYIDGWMCSFVDNWDISKSQANKSTLLDLLFGFSDFYSNFEYGIYVICPLIGKPVPKAFFVDCKQIPTEMKLYKLLNKRRKAVLEIGCGMCIQDPFFLDWNLTRSSKGSTVIQGLCYFTTCILKERKENANTGFLKHLLQEQTLVKWQDQNKSNSNTVKVHIETCLSELVDVEFLSSIEEMQRVWYDKTYTLLKEILSKICQFSVIEATVPAPVTLGESASKLKKVKNNSDVQTITHYPQKILICKSYLPSVLDNRENVFANLQKNGNVTNDTTFIEREEAISKYLIAQSNFNKIVHIKIFFRALSSPTGVMLELLDLASGQPTYSLWSNFLHDKLPVWLAAMLKESGHHEKEINYSNLFHFCRVSPEKQ